MSKLILAWFMSNWGAKSWFSSNMLNYSSIVACMPILPNFELFPWKIVTSMLIVMLSPCFHLVFCTYVSLELALKLWSVFKSCMLCLDFVLEIWFENEFNWASFGLWFYKLSFESYLTMSFKVFSRKWAQEDRIWCLKLDFELEVRIWEF